MKGKNSVLKKYIYEILACLVKVSVFFVCVNFASCKDWQANVIGGLGLVVVLNKLSIRSKCIRIVAMFIESIGYMVCCYSFYMIPILAKLLVQLIYITVVILLEACVSERCDVKKILHNNRYGFISAGIVFALLIIMFAICGVAPFGDNTVMVGDGITQYLPFMSEYRYKILNHESLFFSWNMGLGINFLSVIAYYLTSPFNVFLLLVSRSNIIVCVHFIWILKISATAFAMAYYLTHKKNASIKGGYIIAISLAYSLNNYVFGFANNIMWLDCLILFPLIVLGLEKMLDNGDKKIYVCSLSIAMYCNYYLSFIICIFLVLYFFTQKFDGFKDFIKKGFRFGVSSILSAGIVAFLLIPAYKGLMMTHSAGDAIPEPYFYTNIYNVLNDQFFGTKAIVNNFEHYHVNVYCGVIAIFALFLYGLNNNVERKERVKKILLLSFMFVSCNDEMLNFIWHGFHEQMGVPNRFSFMMIFLLLVITYDTLQESHKISLKRIICGILVGFGYVILCGFKSTEDISILFVLVTMSLILIYGVLTVINKHTQKTVFETIIVFFILAELGVNYINVYFNFKFENVYDIYPRDSSVTEIYNYIQEELAVVDKDIYRTEMVEPTSCGETIWYNMRSMTIFSSTINGKIKDFAKWTGNRYNTSGYFYYGSTPLMDAVYNIKYNIKKNTDFCKDYYPIVVNVDDVVVYENPYTLSVGFAVSNNILEWKNQYGWLFDNQNSFANLAGYEGVIYEDADYYKEEQITEGVLDEKYRSYEFKYPFDTYKRNRYYVKLDEGARYCIYVQGNAEAIYVKTKNSEYLGDYKNQIIDLGYLEINDEIIIEAIGNIEYYSSPHASVFVKKYNHDEFLQAYEVLAQNPMEVLESKETYIKGKISVGEEQVIFTSIPYDEGWKIYVDGELIEKRSFLDAFLVIQCEPGLHVVEMLYRPEGIVEGMFVSLLSVIVTLVLIYLRGKRCGNE